MRHILIVDDESSLRRTMRRMLERVGYNVVEAGSAADALCLLDRATLDVVITDLHMPGGNAFDLTRALRQSGRPQPRIILVSGDEPSEVTKHASTMDAIALAKPFTMEELVDAVAKALAPAPARNVCILIVDDQPDVSLALKYLLEMDGFRIVEAPGGKQALACLAKTDVDVLLTDLFMPEMDGLALLRTLRTQGSPKLRSIAFTGSSNIDRPNTLKEAQLLGASAVLEKPISREMLLQTIHDVLGKESATATVH